MKKRVLFVVDNLPRARFFARFVDTFKQHSIAYRFLAYRLSAHRYLRKRGLDSRLLTYRPVFQYHSRVVPTLESDCSTSLEVLRGDTSLEASLRLVGPVATEIEYSFNDFHPTHLCLWNGSQLIERLFTRLCPADVERRYFEIANVPGKMFVDPIGVNAASSLYSNAESVLAADIPSSDEYEAWRRDYLNPPTKGKVPQAKAAQALQWERPIDALASRFGYGVYPIRLRRMIGRLSGKLRSTTFSKELTNKYGVPTGRDAPYRFFALQVSEDTQLLLNSDIGNLEALRQVFTDCSNDAIDLIVKIHPAENNRESLLRLDSVFGELRQRGNLFLSSKPTTDLIEGSEKVYTINSTVGLETLILNKPLEILGRAFVRSFIDRPDLLRSYLLRYLVPFDYFSDALASPAVIQRMLEAWPDGESIQYE